MMSAFSRMTTQQHNQYQSSSLSPRHVESANSILVAGDDATIFSIDQIIVPDPLFL
jgi:hypothetical protein